MATLRKIESMAFAFRTFSQAFYLSFFRSKGTAAHLSPRRVTILLIFFLVYPLVTIVNRICLWLDDILFPGYRRSPVKEPVFIVGNPRSGTTLLHRLLAQDRHYTYSFLTWHLIFPAITQKKILSLWGRLDHFLGSPMKRLIEAIEARALRNFNKIHHTGLFQPEEDELILLHIFASAYLIFLFPFDQLRWLYNRFDFEAEPKQRGRIMSYYRDCVKRQAYFCPGRTRLISKNPAFTQKIESLYEYFPDCKIICMVRNPLEVIPSMQSILHAVWKHTLDIHFNQDLTEHVYETARIFYRYPLERLPQRDDSSYAIVNYHDLVRQPSTVVKQVYQRFGFTLSPEYAGLLEREDEKVRKYVSRHVYSLEQYNLTRERILEDLKDIFERFGFERG